METIIISLATSLVASIIFWLFFNMIPQKRRYNKIRPVVEYNIYEIFFGILGYLEIGLKTHIHTSFFPQFKIRAGLVTQEEYSFWLKNKCLNETYKIDEIGKYFITVGEQLENSSKEICKKIEECLKYMEFLDAKEILILRKVVSKLTTFSYKDQAEESINGHTYRPVVLHLSYMAENFYELNQLYLDLQKCIWSYKKVDKSINKYMFGNEKIDKAMIYYEVGEYKKCLKLLFRLREDSFSKNRLKFLCYYKLGEKEKAYSILEKFVQNPQNRNIIGIGSLFEETDYKDNEIYQILLQIYTETEILKAIDHSIKIKCSMDIAEKQIKEIDQYYKEKLKESNEIVDKNRAFDKKKYETLLKQVKDKQLEKENVPNDKSILSKK